MTSTISHDRLRELLVYEPEAGHFFWRANHNSRARSGDLAGSLDARGYRTIKIDGHRYRAHRLAWFYVHGTWPSGDVDHRDLNTGNNAIVNLRLASRSQNLANKRAQRNNRSGCKGVSWSKERRKWRASLSVRGRLLSLGYHDTIESAAAAYAAAAASHNGEFARVS